MKSQLLITFAFVAIVIFFLFTRLYKISEVPPSLYWDEASIGYNAYSVLTTGRDEWGEFLPLHFRAFGEFKLPVYIYSVSISEALFGVNEFAVRFPAVCYSVGVLIITYLLAIKITGKKIVGLLSSFVLSLSPWFFIFSRTGYEATAGLMFFLLGLYLFFLSLDKNKKALYLLATISWALSIYSYNSYRIIIPILFPLSLIYYLVHYKKASQIFIVLTLSVIILLISFIPIWRLLKYDAGTSRFSAVKIDKLIDLGRNYFSHFSPNFLLFNGDTNFRSQIPNHGQIYLIELPFILIGVINLIRRKTVVSLVPLLIIIIAPIPASITKESPHALRTLMIVPFLAIVSAVGIYKLSERLIKYKEIFFVLVVALFLMFFENYYVSFLDNYSKQSSEDWQYGYKKIFVDYKNDFSEFDRVVISDEFAQPYIFALFYLKYKPNDFWNSVKYNSVDQWGFSTVSEFGKFKFGKVTAMKVNSKTLIFATDSDKPKGLKPDSKIEFLDGKTAFWIYKV